MPELAEVALFARNLNSICAKQRIRKLSFPNQRDWGSTIVPPLAKRKLRSIIGKNIFFRSVGKALLIQQITANEPLLEIRLGMTGQFHRDKKSIKWKRHNFLTMHFEDDIVFYSDPRRFSRIVAPSRSHFAIGGYDPDLGFWHNKNLVVPDGYLKKPRITWLLDNGNLTGIGNYMANEALGTLALSPFEPCRDKSEAKRILRKCITIARKSFQHGGHSFGSGYFQVNGEEGQYSKFCRFYGNRTVPRYIFKGRPVFSYFNVP